MPGPAARVAAWRRAYEHGCAGELADAVIRQRPVPPRLVAAIVAAPTLDAEASERLRAGDAARLPPPLTPRQTEIVTLAAAGWDDHHIAAALEVSRDTVNSHWRHVFARLDPGRGRANRTRAVAHCIRAGLI